MAPSFPGGPLGPGSPGGDSHGPINPKFIKILENYRNSQIILFYPKFIKFITYIVAEKASMAQPLAEKAVL